MRTAIQSKCDTKSPSRNLTSIIYIKKYFFIFSILIHFAVFLTLSGCKSEGELAYKFQGCMVDGGESRRSPAVEGESDTYFSDEAMEGIRFPRYRSNDGATVQVGNGSIQFEVFFSHACCRTGTIVRRAHGGGGSGGQTDIMLTILLSGNICRCECHSGLHGSLQLPSGRYRLHIQKQNQGEEPQLLYSGLVEVH